MLLLELFFRFFICIRLSEIGNAIYMNQTVKIVRFLVPRYPKTGEDVTLICQFRLTGPRHRLYTVNWWRGRDQFFNYKTSNLQPKTAFQFKGINIKIEESSSEKVVLQNIDENTSGLYRCEVMGEGPTFKTAVDSKRMSVIVPPSVMQISHLVNQEPQNAYSIDDFIQLNCTAHRVKPSPVMLWKINGIEVKKTETQRYADFKDSFGHYTSRMSLHFFAAKYFINQRATVSCLALIKGHRFFAEEELYIRHSSAKKLFKVGSCRLLMVFELFLIYIVRYLGIATL